MVNVDNYVNMRFHYEVKPHNETSCWGGYRRSISGICPHPTLSLMV